MILGIVLAALVSGTGLVEDNHDGERIEVEGHVIGFTESGFAMKVDEIPITVITDRRPFYLTACSIVQPKVRASGVLEQVYGSTASGQAEGVVGLRLRLENPSDLELEPDVRLFVNPFTLGLLLLVVLGYLFCVSRRQLRTRTLMAERKRMADDLHDTIEQHLVGAGMLLQIGKVEPAREILVRAKREMRDIVWGLKNDDMMRLSPAEMIHEYAKLETKKGICRIECRLEGLPSRLEASAMRDLSLIVREAIGNAIKHGGAHKAAIVSDPLGRGGWKLRISNDGRLYDPASAPGPNEGHFGLEGMKARARRLGAELTIAAEHGRTVVTMVRQNEF